jgi:Pentapeptide repeats (8 copies)
MAGPDTNANAPPYPIWGFGPPSPEPDTKKLDALLASLNGSAERFQTLWFSFLGLTLYLAIAALATTHRNLLLGEAQTLPILNIKVELLPFYVIAPLLYLVFHFYLLMMLALLARTAAEFDKQLRTTLKDEADRERYRAQVGNALFLQLLVGMKGERSGVNAFLLGLIALITIVLAPLATLVLMQMMFLPYHHLRITWWHRAVVVADLLLIVVMTYRCFFPRGARKAPLVLGALRRKPRWVTAMAFCIMLAVALGPLAYWLSFSEGRWAGEPRPASFNKWRQWMEGELPESPKVNPDYAATENGVVFGLFPDRLQLRNETIVGEAKLEEIKKEIASRGGDFVPTIKLDERDLQAAGLSGADLRGVSLTGAAMQGANLVATRLDGASISCDRQGDLAICAQLQGANLVRAQLQGAGLSDAGLRGANLQAAQLQGAQIDGAQLQGADLRFAQLQALNSIRRGCKAPTLQKRPCRAPTSS